MAPPSRSQIEATVTQPEYLVEYNAGNGWTPVNSDYILEVDGVLESGSSDHGLSLGALSTAKARIRFTHNMLPISWEGTYVRVSYGFGGSDKVSAFSGIVSNYRDDDDSVEWTCSGWDEVIRRTPCYSPLFYRRPAATATTVMSQENPDAPGYVGGLVNWIFWKAGGRPYEQGFNPSAVFYYSCEYSPITPEWSWIAGEDSWQELDRLAKSCGGQVYQRSDGVMVFTSALSFGGSTVQYTFDEGDYRTFQTHAQAQEAASSIRCSYVTRALQPTSIVYEDATPRVISPADDVTITITPDQPVYTWEIAGNVLSPEHYTATTADGVITAITVTVTERAAGRLSLLASNPTNQPVILSRLEIRGRAIAPVSQGVVVEGSGSPELEPLGNSVETYIQSEMHARRLCTLLLAIYGVPRPVRTIGGCGYDPDREIGEIVGLTNVARGLSAAPHRITRINHSNTGSTMDVGLTPVSGLYTKHDMFVVGTTYAAGDVRRLSY